MIEALVRIEKSAEPIHVEYSTYVGRHLGRAAGRHEVPHILLT
jgi:hypothetical protein